MDWEAKKPLGSGYPSEASDGRLNERLHAIAGRSGPRGRDRVKQLLHRTQPLASGSAMTPCSVRLAFPRFGHAAMTARCQRHVLRQPRFAPRIADNAHGVRVAVGMRLPLGALPSAASTDEQADARFTIFVPSRTLSRRRLEMLAVLPDRLPRIQCGLNFRSLDVNFPA